VKGGGSPEPKLRPGRMNAGEPARRGVLLGSNCLKAAAGVDTGDEGLGGSPPPGCEPGARSARSDDRPVDVDGGSSPKSAKAWARLAGPRLGAEPPEAVRKPDVPGEFCGLGIADSEAGIGGRRSGDLDGSDCDAEAKRLATRAREATLNPGAAVPPAVRKALGDPGSSVSPNKAKARARAASGTGTGVRYASADRDSAMGGAGVACKC
jgi:hypothetical protein